MDQELTEPIRSDKIKQRCDYTITMNYITNMLQKEVPIPTPGSILVGKKYATFYQDKINSMLSTYYMDQDIYKDLCEKVTVDLDFIRQDCKNRVYTQNSNDNNNMMSIITDFILSI